MYGRPRRRPPDKKTARTSREGNAEPIRGPLGRGTEVERIRSSSVRFAVRVERDGVWRTHSIHPDRQSAERIGRSLRWAGRIVRVVVEGAP